MAQLLTKSKYLAGLECSRHLWTLLHDQEKIPEPNAADKFRMEQEVTIGKLATKLFSNGINLANLNFYDNIAKSKALLCYGFNCSHIRVVFYFLCSPQTFLISQ